MTLSEVERAMASIEGLDATLDPDKAKVYMSLAKEFVARAGRYCDMHGLPRVTPFIDPMSEFQERLPEHLERRLSAWEEGPRGLNPFVLMACRFYLRYLAGRESLPPEQRDDADIYAPLFQLLMQGGDFYMHHGDLCVTDVGTIFLIGR